MKPIPSAVLPLGLIFSFLTPARSAESSFTLPPLTVTGRTSFETLREESLAPTTVIQVDGSRSTLLDDLKWNTLFPVRSFGYPSGQNGISLGGRSIDDTQVTTLGIPLNQSIGGGADLSAFPGFLWSEVRFAPSTTSAGFIQQSASGNLDLTPWSWSILSSQNEPDAPSRLTASWDRDLQTLSIGTRKSDISILAGTSLGRQTGPAGSLSYRFLKTPQWVVYANVLGTDQEGDDPGSTTFPTPGGKKKTTRVTPSFMGHYSSSNDLSVQTTLFGDFQRLESTSSFFSSLDRTRTVGIENAITSGDTVFSFSARNVDFTNTTAGNYSEWPAHFGVTQKFQSASGTRVHVTASSEYLSGFGFHPGARVSSEVPLESNRNLFFEVQALPKLPSIQDRLYVDPSIGFTGNPNLLPERVYAAIAGFEDRKSTIQNKTQIRAEARDQVILIKPDFSSVENAGTAQFMSLSETISARITPWIQVRADALASYSRLSKNEKPYPRMPGLSAGGAVTVNPRDSLSLESQAKWMGRSREADGSPFDAYVLLGEKIKYLASENLILILGVDNLLDSRIEMIRGYPLPGRSAYASAELRF